MREFLLTQSTFHLLVQHLNMIFLTSFTFQLKSNAQVVRHNYTDSG